MLCQNQFENNFTCFSSPKTFLFTPNAIAEHRQQLAKVMRKCKIIIIIKCKMWNLWRCATGNGARIWENRTKRKKTNTNKQKSNTRTTNLLRHWNWWRIENSFPGKLIPMKFQSLLSEGKKFCRSKVCQSCIAQCIAGRTLWLLHTNRCNWKLLILLSCSIVLLILSRFVFIPFSVSFSFINDLLYILFNRSLLLDHRFSYTHTHTHNWIFYISFTAD